MADEAVPIGPPPAAESYLRIDRIVDAARRTGAQAVHPGYGFLSENPAFAEALEAAGHRLHRPAGERDPADGRQARGQAPRGRGRGQHRAGPSPRRSRDPELAARIAAEIGYPVMIKAAAGGGGKGMRVAPRRRAICARRSSGPQSEARSSFGDDRVFLEKFVARAAPHRDPGAGRPPRQRALSGRARMLDPAPPSEGDRGGAEPVPRRRHPARDGRAGGGAGARGRLPLGRHGRVHRRCRAQLLFPRDEHPAPGRAPGDRAGDRARSGRADAAGSRPASRSS